MIADPHFGKAAAFRFGGIPVPEGNAEADLARLSEVVEQSGCQRLLILGDFLHARAGRTDETFANLAKFLAGHRQLDVLLVRGNHDRHAGDPPGALGIRCVTEPCAEDDIVLRHFPPDACEQPTLAGHLHPAVLLQGGGSGRMQAPCFWVQKRLMVLPAFGSFTGCARIRPGAGERVFAVGEEDVIEITRRVRNV